MSDSINACIFNKLLMLGFNGLAVISEHPAAVAESRRLSDVDFSLFEGTWPFLGQSALDRLQRALICFVLMYVNHEFLNLDGALGLNFQGRNLSKKLGTREHDLG